MKSKLCVSLASLIVVCAMLLVGCGGGSQGGSGTGNGTPPAIAVSILEGSSAALDHGQTKALSVAVANDSRNAGVTWSVSGPGSLTGHAATTATYVAPASGAPSTATVTATSVSDPTKLASITLQLSPPPTIASTPAPSAGTNGTAYCFSVPASGGTSPLAWSISKGALPAGLSLDQTGKICGTPNANSATSPYSFSVSVQDSVGVTDTEDYSLTINNPPPPQISSAAPPTAVNGDEYLPFTFAISTGGLGPFAWSETGALPPGMGFTSAGVLSGKPQQIGSFPITVGVQDSSNPQQTAHQAFTITVVNPPAPSIATSAVANGIQGTPYNQVISATSGLAPFTWSVISGALSPGLVLNSSSGPSVIISGTPTTIQTGVQFTIQITDAANRSDSHVFTMDVDPAPVVTIGNKLNTIEAGGVAVKLNATVQNDPGTHGVTWALTVNGSPCTSSACGFLSSTGPDSVIYTSPSTLPASPNDAPTITASSVLDGTRSDTNTFTIVPADNANCNPRGNESVLNGQYAFSLSGWKGSGFVALVGAFTADGAGHISAGEADSNGDGILQPVHDTLNTSLSSYSVGADNRGCAKFVTSFGTFITRIALGSLSSGMAARGRMIEWETGASAYVASGRLLKQNPADFVGGLSGNYTAFSASTDIGVRFASVATMSANSGSFSDLQTESNSAGSVTPILAGTGTYTSFNANGRGEGTTHYLGGSSSFAMYMVSSSSLLHISTDGGGARDAGQIRQQNGAFDATSLNGKAIVYATGGGTAGLKTASADGNGAVTMASTDDAQGTLVQKGPLACSYSVAANGRTTITGSNCAAAQFVLYLTGPNEGFLFGTDSAVSVGEFEPQASGPFAATSLSGTLFVGTDDMAGQSEASVAQVTADANSNLAFMSDEAGLALQTGGQLSSRTIAIQSDGSFTLNGTAPGFLISGSKFVAIEPSDATKPSILVGEK